MGESENIFNNSIAIQSITQLYYPQGHPS